MATTLVHAQFRRTSQPGNRGSGSTPPDEARARLAEASARAAKAFPSLPTANSGTLPSVRQMEQEFRADPAGGRKVFDSLCAACHSLGGERRMGPDLSAIGTKLDRQALLDAIVMPSAAISFGYESWTVETKSRGALSGLLIEDTPERVTLKVDATQEVRLAPADITGRRSIPVSTMPEGLVEGMTPQQITDLVAFLATQRAR